MAHRAKVLNEPEIEIQGSLLEETNKEAGRRCIAECREMLRAARERMEKR